MTRITRAEDVYGIHNGVPVAYSVEHFHAALHDREPRDMPKRKARVSLAVCTAFIEAGRWVVSCPFCNSAQYATPDDPRFFCVDCGNAAAGGAWLTVRYPANVAEIELLLTRRPNVSEWNWHEPMTADDLQEATPA